MLNECEKVSVRCMHRCLHLQDNSACLYACVCLYVCANMYMYSVDLCEYVHTERVCSEQGGPRKRKTGVEEGSTQPSHSSILGIQSPQ